MPHIGSNAGPPALARTQRWAAAWCRTARRPRLAVGGVIVAALASVILVTSIAGIPEPEVHDEQTMLVMADIFAHGRLCEPTHPHWQHFEANYLLAHPCTQGKYPPGLSLYMALGRRVTGQFIAGVWVAVAVMIGAAGYAMYGVLPPRWALVGTILMALRFGVAGDWALSYWGGAVGAAGGALVFGAIARLPNLPRARDGALLGAGLVMLALSRPYEGLMWSLPALALLAFRVWQRWTNPRRLAGPAAAAAAVAAAGLGWLGYYNATVTGSPFLLPYTLYEQTHTTTRLFVFQRPRAMPPVRNAQMAGIETYLQYEAGRARSNWPLEKLRDLSAVFWDVLKPALVFAVIGLYRMKRWKGAARLACLSLAAICIATSFTSPATADRYLAPAMVSIFFLATAGLAGLAGRRFTAVHGGPIAAAILLLTVAAVTGAAASHVHDARTSREWWAAKRDIRSRLLSDPGNDLVFVRYANSHNPHQEWVFNGADLDAQPIVWAREMGPDADRRLRSYFAHRKAWVVLVDNDPPQLAPWLETR